MMSRNDPEPYFPIDDPLDFYPELEGMMMMEHEAHYYTDDSDVE